MSQQDQPMSARPREQLIAEIFHELTQPLTTLHCCLELVLQKIPRSAKFRTDLQVALQQADKVAKLVAQVRELVEADKVEIQPFPQPAQEPAPPLVWPSRCCR